MEKSTIFHAKVLQILAIRYGTNCTLEQLTRLVDPINNLTIVDIHIEIKQQARVLDALIILNDYGYIFLDPNTDNSTITIKGLNKINSKIFCN